jgi:phosphoribosylformylglycinamidine synthase
VSATHTRHRTLGLTDWEFERICSLLGRTPNIVELTMFSVLWSEHCGYKHSARLLRRLPSEGRDVLQGPGGNAGVIDLGGGMAVAFKAESHNHPTAVEPFQGAATGVGGILRDIVAMGATPIALLDGLRFGPSDWRFERAVAGIGWYANCAGVATVGGETVFDHGYDSNPLVNVMCAGLLPSARVLNAKTLSVGSLLVLYGATTGRDGIGGASVLASQDLAGSDEKRPTVQIGDPFRAKALIEVSRELVEHELVVGLQDCGAAGLSSALAEMTSEAVGLELDLDCVLLREPGLNAAEIMVSESQERMIAVVEPAKLDAVMRICERWELPCSAIGHLSDDGMFRVHHGGELVAELPARHLTADTPRYELEQSPQGSIAPGPRHRRNEESPRWIYERYDHLVGSRTVRRPGLDAAVLDLGDGRGLALSFDGPAPGERDPYRAGWSAVMDAALNVACAGGRPLALTDCLNFGNPERPEIAWELASAIEGISSAAEELGLPVVSGNVSLYNDTNRVSIPPTPVVGCVGLVDDLAASPSRWRRGDRLVLLAGEGAELVRFVWQNAARFTLAHDLSDSGGEAAIREAGEWSGVATGLECPSQPGVIVALAPGDQAPLDWPESIELGTI